MSAAFKVVADDSGPVRDVHDVDAGKLGGVMRCGVTVDKEGDIAVCGWADNGSVAVALFPGRPVADAAKAMLQLRDGGRAPLIRRPSRISACCFVLETTIGPHRSEGLSRIFVRRRPTLPHSLGCSTIGAGGLSFRVRNGTGRFPSAMAAVTL